MGFLTRAPRHARKPGGDVPRRQFLLGLAFAVAACGPATQSPRPAAAAGEWLEFEGSWNGAGSRHTISLGEDRVGSIVDLKGTMLLAGPGRPGVGFHSEVIGLVDSATGFQGRSVWTDEHGDQVFSELQGEGTAAKNHDHGHDPLRHGALRRRDRLLRILLAVGDGGRGRRGPRARR